MTFLHFLHSISIVTVFGWLKRQKDNIKKTLPHWVTSPVLGRRWSPRRKDREYDTVLPGNSYRAAQGAVIVECGTMAELWSAGESRRKSEIYVLHCHFVHHGSHTKPPGIANEDPWWEAGVWLSELWRGIQMLSREGVTFDGVLDWWLDLLTTLITWNYILQITDTHRRVSSVYYSLH
jgi:hypothetical protein